MIGEGNYNLNILEEIKVTDSYLGLDKTITGCQTKESYHSCITRNYIDKLMKTCNCLPLSMSINKEVWHNLRILDDINHFWLRQEPNESLCPSVLTKLKFSIFKAQIS